MAQGAIGAEIVARLRANAAAAGIAIDEDDLARMAGGAFLRNVDLFGQLIARLPTDTLPDDLKEWRDTRPEPAAAGAPPPAPDPSPPAPAPPDPSDPFAPLHQVARALAAREVSPVALTETMLARIAAHDPPLNAYQIVMHDEALAAAAAAEREIAAGRRRGPFHGVPVAIKDLLATRGIPTAAGSKILGAWIPDEDATAVRLLREAGAVIVGKTRMSEFAYSPGSNNAHYGPTHNPWGPGRDAGGSSSGSGAAVAAGLAYAALGSDTGGSIRMPAALCGLVGLADPRARQPRRRGHPLLVARPPRPADPHRPRRRPAAQPPRRPRPARRPHPPRTRPRLHRRPGGGARGLRIGAVRDDGSAAPPTPRRSPPGRTGCAPCATPAPKSSTSTSPKRKTCASAAPRSSTLRRRPSTSATCASARATSARSSATASPSPTPTARPPTPRRSRPAPSCAPASTLWERLDLLSTPAMAHGAPPSARSIRTPATPCPSTCSAGPPSSCRSASPATACPRAATRRPPLGRGRRPPGRPRRRARRPLARAPPPRLLTRPRACCPPGRTNPPGGIATRASLTGPWHPHSQDRSSPSPSIGRGGAARRRRGCGRGGGGAGRTGRCRFRASPNDYSVSHPW